MDINNKIPGMLNKQPEKNSDIAETTINISTKVLGMLDIMY
jgi:hypothetical protein